MNSNESNETRDAHANETGNATAEQVRDEPGPSTSMPEPVPAFVSDLHEQIWEHLNGNISRAELGEALSSLTLGRDTAAPADQADDHRQDGDETPTPTPTESPS